MIYLIYVFLSAVQHHASLSQNYLNYLQRVTLHLTATACPRNLDIVGYYIKWDKTSRTHSMFFYHELEPLQNSRRNLDQW